jgi:protoporphyrinogen oxidase
MGAVVLVVSLDRQLTNFYWHSLPKEAGFPFLALVEHTNFMDREHYGGDTLIYCGDYLETDHEYFSPERRRIAGEVPAGVQAVQPRISIRSWVKQTWLWKAAYAQPIPPSTTRRTSLHCARRCLDCTSPA